jgi:hypothetical protein
LAAGDQLVFGSSTDESDPGIDSSDDELDYDRSDASSNSSDRNKLIIPKIALFWAKSPFSYFGLVHYNSRIISIGLEMRAKISELSKISRRFNVCFIKNIYGEHPCRYQRWWQFPLKKFINEKNGLYLYGECEYHIDIIIIPY